MARPVLHTWLLTALAVTGAFADLNYLQKSELCASGCGYALFPVSFNGKPPAQMAGTSAPIEACADSLWIRSMFYCSALYCEPENLQRALTAQNASCVGYLGMPLPPYSAPPDLHNLTMVSQMQAKSMTFKQPVVPDRDLYQAGYTSLKNYNYAQYTNWDFVWGLYGFWGLVLLIGIGSRIVYLSRTFSSPKPDQIEGASNASAQQGRSLVARSSDWFQSRLVVPFALGSRERLPSGYSSLPTRLETALIVFYLILNLVFCFPGYHLLTGDTFLALPKEQLAKYIANRLGSLAVGNIPVVWLFAARNDPLLWVTGWSYATYSQFHRWSARILLLLIIGHAIANSVLTSDFGHMTYEELFKQVFVKWGLVGIVSLSVLVGTSFFFMRNRLYDFWLIIHFVFAVIVLIAVFYHTKEVDGAYNGFLWFAVAIWALDRLLRLARLVYVNLVPTTRGARAVARYDPATDMIRVNVTPFFGSSQPPPGSYYFLYEPARLRGYESHPFSLCSWPSTQTPSPSSSSAAPVPVVAEIPESDEKPHTDSEPSLSPAVSSPLGTAANAAPLQHTFLIKPRRGFTRRLQTRALAAASSPAGLEFPVLLEGPYGPDLHLHKYPRVAILVGGSGISAAVSRVHALLAPGRETRVLLVWAARQRAFVEDVLARELGAALGDSRLRVEVYITKDESDAAGAEGKVGQGKGREVMEKARHGRPEIYELLRRERVEGAGPLAVLVCGPAPLEEGVRKAVGRLLREKEGVRVAFFGERFGW